MAAPDRGPRKRRKRGEQPDEIAPSLAIPPARRNVPGRAALGQESERTRFRCRPQPGSPLSISSCCFLLSRPLGDHHGGNSAARTKLAFHLSPCRPSPSHDIGQHLIHRILLENTQVTICLEIFFQRLQFETPAIGRVTDHKLAEIGQARFRANRGKFGIIHDNLVSGKLVFPGFNLRKGLIEPGAGVLQRISRSRGTGRMGAGNFRHPVIVPRAGQNRPAWRTRQRRHKGKQTIGARHLTR